MISTKIKVREFLHDAEISCHCRDGEHVRGCPHSRSSVSELAEFIDAIVYEAQGNQGSAG